MFACIDIYDDGNGDDKQIETTTSAPSENGNDRAVDEDDAIEDRDAKIITTTKTTQRPASKNAASADDVDYYDEDGDDENDTPGGPPVPSRSPSEPLCTVSFAVSWWCSQLLNRVDSCPSRKVYTCR